MPRYIVEVTYEVTIEAADRIQASQWAFEQTAEILIEREHLDICLVSTQARLIETDQPSMKGTS